MKQNSNFIFFILCHLRTSIILAMFMLVQRQLLDRSEKKRLIVKNGRAKKGVKKWKKGVYYQF